MKSRLQNLIFLSIFLMNVDSLSLNGPALTRYDPCGLGIIHFDKIYTRYWQGVVNFGLYNNLREVEMIIHFDNPVIIYGASLNTSLFVRRNNWQDFIIKPWKPIPHQYMFFVYINSNGTSVPTLTKFVLNNVTLCNNEIKTAHTITSLNISRDANVDQSHICGRRSMEHTELVSVRTEAKAGDWPWHVAIFLRDENSGDLKYQCGGNIISRVAILTAGHCVYLRGSLIEADRVVIVAGVDDHKDLSQSGRQTLTATKVILHPSYNDKLATSDLAIIRVDRLEYTEYVQPICVWGPVYDKTNLFGQEAVVIGFGATENDTLSNTLRVSYTIVQNDLVCLAYAPDIYTGLLNEFTFCVGFGPQAGINPRNGDSGGGLVVPTVQPDHMISWFLRGVLSKCGVSNGSAQCDQRFYVVYTDVGPHYGWIYHHSGLNFRGNVQ